MATRRHPALPMLALAAAVGATAFAAVTADRAAARPTGTHVAASCVGSIKDWNSMVPEGGCPPAA